MLKRILALSAICLMMSVLSPIGGAFVVKKIQYEGLGHVPESTVQAVMPFKIGQNLTAKKSNHIIDALNQTGFFNDIKLYQKNGSTLLVRVQARPSIAYVHFKGNQLIKTNQLQKVLDNAGLTVGSIYQATVLHQVKTALEAQYISQSKYAVRITTVVATLPRNRVGIDIHISEGLTASIKHINIIGNHAYSESRLIDELVISTPSLWGFITGEDHYSQAKLDKSLAALQSFYMDRGYIHFQVRSTQASITPDKKHFYVTINIHEGHQYRFSGYAIKGQQIIANAELAKLISVKAGEVFSRAQVMQSAKHIDNQLANQGYAFAQVRPVPKLNEKAKTVGMTFYINPGEKYMIHHISFRGDNVTNDKTLRERMMIAEGATYSRKALNESKISLEQLPYIGAVIEKPKPVKNKARQVNVNYDIQEKSANNATFNIGYSELDKFLIGGSFGMANLFGTGNNFNVSTQLSKPSQSLSFSFIQPYFTQTGISQTFTVYGNRIDNSKRNLVNYSSNTFGGKLSYGIPMGPFSKAHLGGGYNYTKLLQPSGDTSMTVQNFVGSGSGQYNSYELTGGWSFNDTNSPWFPTKGTQESINGEVAVPGSDLQWYKIMTKAVWYQSLGGGFTVSLGGKTDYGNGYGKTSHLPFFDNFYGGGWGSVRGFAPGSLGPDDDVSSGSTPQEGNSIGGNLSLLGSLNLYFPVPFVHHQSKFRMGVFVDAGNVYDTYDVQGTYASTPKNPNFDNLRYSTGLSFQWLSPMGLIGFSLAKALNTKPGDDTQVFNISLGSSF